MDHIHRGQPGGPFNSDESHGTEYDPRYPVAKSLGYRCYGDCVSDRNRCSNHDCFYPSNNHQTGHEAPGRLGFHDTYWYHGRTSHLGKSHFAEGSGYNYVKLTPPHNKELRQKQDRDRKDWTKQVPACGIPCIDASGQHKDSKGSKAVVDDWAVPVYLEVAPGVKEVLCRFYEITRAIERDYYISASCWGGPSVVYCIADASFFLCPCCKSFSPLKQTLVGPKLQQSPYGVALAFTYDIILRAKRKQRCSTGS